MCSGVLLSLVLLNLTDRTLTKLKWNTAVQVQCNLVGIPPEATTENGRWFTLVYVSRDMKGNIT